MFIQFTHGTERQTSREYGPLLQCLRAGFKIQVLFFFKGFMSLSSSLIPVINLTQPVLTRTANLTWSDS